MNYDDIVLERAIEIVQDKWAQGSFEVFSEEGELVGYCAYGALCVAADSLGLERSERIMIEDKVEKRVDEVLPLFYSPNPDAGLMALAQFNDDPNTTKEDVILLFKETLYRG